MKPIEKGGRNEEVNKNVEEAGNKRYGGRGGGGGWVGGLDTPLLPLMGVSPPDAVKKQSSANLWYIFTIWMMTKSE